MGCVIRFNVYDKEKVYFVQELDEKKAKEKALEMFRQVVSLEVSVGIDESGESIYDDLDTIEKFEEYYWIDSGYEVEVVATDVDII